MSSDGDRAPPGYARDHLRESFVTGLAVVVPLAVTLAVLGFVLDQIYGYLDVFSDVVVSLPFTSGVLSVPGELLVEILTPVVLLATVLTVGLVVNGTRYGERAVDYFDYAMTSVPGVGSVYESFRQMSDVMLDSDTQNFREVKLVEFPHEGAYTLGFVTTETPEALAAPTGHDRLLTMFLPLAPNPVMGGHLVHVPADRVMDVDMTVEEGVRAVVTSGVAVGGATASSPGLSPDQMQSLSTAARADQRLDPEQSPDVQREASERDRTEWRARYDERVDPVHVGTPGDIARRERGEVDSGEAASRPAERADRSAAARDDTDARPAELADRRAADRDETETRPAERADRSAAARDGTDARPAAAAHRSDADSDDTRVPPAAAAGRDPEDATDGDDRSGSGSGTSPESGGDRDGAPEGDGVDR